MKSDGSDRKQNQEASGDPGFSNQICKIREGGPSGQSLRLKAFGSGGYQGGLVSQSNAQAETDCGKEIRVGAEEHHGPQTGRRQDRPAQEAGRRLQTDISQDGLTASRSRKKADSQGDSEEGDKG